MDEQTPHLHVTVVPIVTTERKRKAMRRMMWMSEMLKYKSSETRPMATTTVFTSGYCFFECV